jgi:fructoselysine-6-P-deglycase FrlB-like protein
MRRLNVIQCGVGGGHGVSHVGTYHIGTVCGDLTKSQSQYDISYYGMIIAKKGHY